MRLTCLLRPSLRRFLSVTLFSLMIAMATAVVTACEWDYLIWMVRSKSADPLYRFVENGKVGFIDQSGKVVIKPQFEFYDNQGDEFETGLMHLQDIREGQYVDATGKLVINKTFEAAWDFSEELAAAMPKGSNKWGYIDRSGEFVISPRFENYPKGYVSSFSDGLAMIEVHEKYGYIDRSGEFVIRPTYLLGFDFREGLARAVVEGPCGYVSPRPCPDYRLLGEKANGDVPACKFAFIDKSGAVISPDRYEKAQDFSEGLAAVRVEGKWGYIDKTGRVQIAPTFDDVGPFSDGLARVTNGKLSGYVDQSGKFCIKPEYGYAEDFSEGLAVVSNHWDAKKAEYLDFHYIDKAGRQAIAEDFGLASPFFKGLAHVRLKSQKEYKGDPQHQKGIFAYIDRTGRRVFVYRNRPED